MGDIKTTTVVMFIAGVVLIYSSYVNRYPQDVVLAALGRAIPDRHIQEPKATGQAAPADAATGLSGAIPLPFTGSAGV